MRLRYIEKETGHKIDFVRRTVDSLGCDDSIGIALNQGMTLPVDGDAIGAHPIRPIAG